MRVPTGSGDARVIANETGSAGIGGRGGDSRIIGKSQAAIWSSQVRYLQTSFGLSELVGNAFGKRLFQLLGQPDL